MKASELREKTIDELTQELQELKMNFLNYAFSMRQISWIIQ